MKILIYALSAVIIFIVFCFFVFFDVSRDGIALSSQTKPILKVIAGKISGVIYRFGTKFNPEGDVVPDEIDDRIKRKIKDTL